jgi:hypothetical protein
MNAPINLKNVDRIRLRDGDNCWACNGKLDFGAVPNSKKAPTIEHLQARANGGGQELENLVLTHPGCNRMLGTKPVEKKREIRAKLHANTARTASSKSGKATMPHTAGVARAATSIAKASVPARRVPATPSVPQADEDLRYWRRLALLGGGTGLVSLGFAAGLLTGILLF